MKKLLIPTLLVVALAVGWFAFYHRADMVQEKKCVVAHAEELQVMGMQVSKIAFSPIVSAMMYAHLKDHDLQLTMPICVMSTYPLSCTDTLYCGFACAGQQIFTPLNFCNPFTEISRDSFSCAEKWTNNAARSLQPGEYTRYENTYLYCLEFSYEMSQLLPLMEEMEILSYIEKIPSTIKCSDIFIGRNSDLEWFKKGIWKEKLLID